MEARKEIDIKKGQVVVFSQGEYSDHSFIIVCRALKDFTEKDLKAYESRGQVPENCGTGTKRSNMAIVSALYTDGFFEEIIVTEIHMGSYGEEDNIWNHGNIREQFEEENDEKL